MAKTRFSTIVFMLFLLLMPMLLLPVTAAATVATTVEVHPSALTVDPGDDFTVDVYVVPGTAIAGLQFDITWDIAVLEYTGVTEGDLLSQYPPGCGTYFAVMGGVYPDDGFVDGVAGVVLGAGCEVSGPGIFATVSFHAKASGTSSLALTDVIVGDLTGTEVPSETADGFITVTGGVPQPVFKSVEPSVVEVGISRGVVRRLVITGENTGFKDDGVARNGVSFGSPAVRVLSVTPVNNETLKIFVLIRKAGISEGIYDVTVTTGKGDVIIGEDVFSVVPAG